MKCAESGVPLHSPDGKGVFRFSFFFFPFSFSLLVPFPVGVATASYVNCSLSLPTDRWLQHLYANLSQAELPVREAAARALAAFCRCYVEGDAAAVAIVLKKCLHEALLSRVPVTRMGFSFAIGKYCSISPTLVVIGYDPAMSKSLAWTMNMKKGRFFLVRLSCRDSEAQDSS
jgi:hypothetical protein